MKSRRQRAIMTLVTTRPVHSQDELATMLEQQGFETTQATISRDIKELGLAKIPLKDGSGAFKYVVPGSNVNFASRLHRVVVELVTSVKGSENLIVLRTPPGSAMMVATAIDEGGWTEIIGTMGGDDTVIVVVGRAKDLPVVMQRFSDLRES